MKLTEALHKRVSNFLKSSLPSEFHTELSLRGLRATQLHRAPHAGLTRHAKTRTLQTASALVSTTTADAYDTALCNMMLPR